MLDPEFVSGILELNLTDEQTKLNRLFIHALQVRAKNDTAEKVYPLGLPMSAIVANIALIELDRIIEQHIAPIHYGRAC